jgi:uncharacterized membrane protein YeaQ/YmgE (transglycosylase-associated protein family)
MLGLVGDIVVGIPGAIIATGCFRCSASRSTPAGLFGAISMAFIGAVILLVIVKVIKHLTT